MDVISTSFEGSWIMKSARPRIVIRWMIKPPRRSWLEEIVCIFELYITTISGQIPPEIGALPNLQNLDLSLSSNGFSGRMPPLAASNGSEATNFLPPGFSGGVH
ncbi:hypothetical protein RHMOL_Rhmol03G0286600 [Rhododendron molle]|uniref:Uncharacterized protein n=1 Tax=Rhododendron molle TaxID=49168 RepID=A0ACC0PJ52_RHOML|nr:hypothetical protein RHMOL_Rhmol03G0286600 [Rhododendron molle]